jgi:HEAT repeat protein
MTLTRLATVVLVTAAILPPATAAAQSTSKPAPARGAAPTEAELTAAIDQLGSFNFDTRTSAARTVRRAAGTMAAPALERAVRSHKDEYVRFRAAVLLTGTTDAAAPLMRELVTDRNDRLRTIAYQWWEHHPNPAVLPTLLAALPRERSEFVRPALTRALAAHGTDARAREALVPLVLRGEDLFRGALIEALGDFRASYAVASIAEVAKLDGPLQDDAITALGKIGDPAARPTLESLQRSAPPEVQPTLSAAFCLLHIDCERQEAYVKQALEFGMKDPDGLPVLRGVVHALGMLAVGGRTWALSALIDAGGVAPEPAREAVALGLGLVVLRRPVVALDVLAARTDLANAMELFLEAFDMLSEDFEEERFYVEIRNAFWSAPEGSPRRRAAERLIATLEF